MSDLIRTQTVRSMLACIEQELARSLASRAAIRSSRLLRLRLVLLAAQWAELPMDEVCGQVCQALTNEPRHCDPRQRSGSLLASTIG